MSVTIRSKYGNEARIEAWDGDQYVSLTLLFEDDEEHSVVLPRAEFLAAVAAELDVIVIPRADLPEVTVRDGEALFGYGQNGHTKPLPEGISPDEMIALGLHLKAHPPVDEAQVSTLVVALESLDDLFHPGSDWTYEDLARRLLATGRVTVGGAK